MNHAATPSWRETSCHAASCLASQYGARATCPMEDKSATACWLG